MTAATLLQSSGLKVLIGDGASPTELFAHPCALPERSLNLSAETSETAIPNCVNEDAATWIERRTRTRSATITGTGMLATQSSPTWTRLFGLDTPFNIRVEVPGTGAQGGGQWRGTAILTGLEYGATVGQAMQVNVNIISAGNWTWTPTP